MKGMLKYLSPFAPDQSGAVSVLYDMGGITVICDAGGCTGNICGFDEPRWTDSPRPVFSAGLRDMDAILGRDDKLVEKLGAVSGKNRCAVCCDSRDAGAGGHCYRLQSTDAYDGEALRTAGCGG